MSEKQISQMQRYEQARRFNAGLDRIFMDMVKADDISREELQALIARRPAVYERFSGWVAMLPSRSAPTRNTQSQVA